ncbi:MAG TPA: porin family protein [Phnomibacter sp.]|nr:porin family protein [Phnomibacter sp.]
MKFRPLFAGLVLAGTLLSQTSQGQISIGAKGGLNVSNLSGVSDVQGLESNALVGFHVGGYATFNLGRNFAIHPELVYSTQGAKLENATSSENLNLNYFNIPIMVRFLTNKGFFVEAGPQFGFQVGDVDLGTIGQGSNFQNTVNNSDLAACVGLGFQPTKSAFGIGARYNIGLGKAGEFDPNTSGNNVEYKNGVFQLSLYWRLLGGGKLKK